MRIGIPRERYANERRVAATPDSVGRLKKLGVDVWVESGAGKMARFEDEAYTAAGASIVADRDTLLAEADAIVQIQPPEMQDVDLHREGSILISMLKPAANGDLLEKLAVRKLSAFSLELVPRSTRAQSMDILSSQANLAGYKAAIDAASMYGGLFPMLMTAAGTVRAARVLVIGAGVAGLQAIATAKRLGAVVSAFDIRAAAKEEVKSLGAKFVELDLRIKDGEQKGGYARELSDEERKKQTELLADVASKSDIVITTAAVPGRPAPKIVTADTVHRMKPGSVIFDLAAESGGNCELTRPGQTYEENGVTIMGVLNVPSLLPTEASNLFARNVYNFIANLVDKEGQAAIRVEDDIIAATLVTHDGTVRYGKN
jgi:NAD(P) transhydrogenase subunit alpha